MGIPELGKERSLAISKAALLVKDGWEASCAREGTANSITRKEPETARETSFMASLLCHPVLDWPDLASSCHQRYQKSSSKGSFYFQWSCRFGPQRPERPDQLHWGAGWGRRGRDCRSRRRESAAPWFGRRRRRARGRNRSKRRCRGRRREFRRAAWERSRGRRPLRGYWGNSVWRVRAIRDRSLPIARLRAR